MRRRLLELYEADSLEAFERITMPRKTYTVGSSQDNISSEKRAHKGVMPGSKRHRKHRKPRHPRNPQ